ncbi:MAG: M20/M25/M40 family metallo-hydrolase, partial [Firmicutes bacterium]|nr:M20/M25/M40 family metallo-hydrolase [Bacillota bacterium]
MNDTTLKRRARETANFTQDIRRKLHRIPELGFEEHKTQRLIMDTLDSLGIPYTAERTWVIGTIAGKAPGKTVALRADIDGLPIAEQTGLPFASAHEGRMHACGHDAHAAILLGT